MADSATFSRALGDLSAEAVFEWDGVSNELNITLTNTSLVDAMVPTDILTAVFWQYDGTLSLTGTSAIASSVLFGSTGPGGDVGGEWAYAEELTGAPNGASFGISSAGFDLFGPTDRFNTNDLDAPDSPNGLNYGITSAGDDPTTGSWPVTGKEPLIQNSVIFTLAGIDQSTFDLDNISNVAFQYGTSFDEPNLVPLPPAAAIGILGLGIVALFRRPKKAEHR